MDRNPVGIGKTLEDFVGNTPLVRLKRIPGETSNVILAKLEGNNPAGSVKDRPALSMIRKAEERGADQAGRHADRADQRQYRHRAGDGRGDAWLSHDPGHAGAPVGRAATDHGGVRREVRADAEEWRHGNGARRCRTDAGARRRSDPRPVRQSRQSTGALRRDGTGDLARHAWTAHALRQQHGNDRHDHGLLALLQGKESGDQIVGCQPTEGSQIPGIRKWPEAYLPKIFDRKRVDRIIEIAQADAEEMTRRLAREEGIFAGVSSGGALWAALQISAETENATIVTIVCDRGDRYLSTGVFPVG